LAGNTAARPRLSTPRHRCQAAFGQRYPANRYAAYQKPSPFAAGCQLGDSVSHDEQPRSFNKSGHGPVIHPYYQKPSPRLVPQAPTVPRRERWLSQTFTFGVENAANAGTAIRTAENERRQYQKGSPLTEKTDFRTRAVERTGGQAIARRARSPEKMRSALGQAKANPWRDAALFKGERS
jgi:hypothetical protein